jgi:hypothetical protein
LVSYFFAQTQKNYLTNIPLSGPHARSITSISGPHARSITSIYSPAKPPVLYLEFFWIYRYFFSVMLDEWWNHSALECHESDLRVQGFVTSFCKCYRQTQEDLIVIVLLFRSLFHVFYSIPIILLLFLASYSQSMWYDLLGAGVTWLGPYSTVVGKRAAWITAWRIRQVNCCSLPLGITSLPHFCTEKLQSKLNGDL